MKPFFSDNSEVTGAVDFDFDEVDPQPETKVETTPREMTVMFGVLGFMGESMTATGMVARFVAVANDVAPQLLNGKTMARIAAESGVTKQSFHQAKAAWRQRKAAVVAAAKNERTP